AKRRNCVKASLRREAPDFCHGRTIPSLVPRFGETTAVLQARRREALVVIFDCNGVLVDSEQIAAAAAADEFARAGIPITPELVTRYFSGRRPADMLASIEAATRRKLPVNFGATLAATTLARLRAELRAMPHAAHALTWLRGPKCVASSSPPDRVRASLETAGLAKFFNLLFSASDVRNSSPRRIYSCTRRRGWVFRPPTASWSRIPRLVWP